MFCNAVDCALLLLVVLGDMIWAISPYLSQGSCMVRGGAEAVQHPHDLRLVLSWHLQKGSKQRDDALQAFSKSPQPLHCLHDMLRPPGSCWQLELLLICNCTGPDDCPCIANDIL